MARPEDGIAAQIRNIERASGKPVSAWIDLVTASRLSRHPDIVAAKSREAILRARQRRVKRA